MPEHTSWFTYLMALPGLQHLERSLDGRLLVYPSGTPVTLEYTALAMFAMVVLLVAVLVARMRFARTEAAVIPDGKLTTASFIENFVEVFYGMLKDGMGPRDARFFLPIIGTCAIFIFFSNALGVIPGFAPPTSNLNVTLACGLIIFLTTHFYGFRRNGFGYIRHFLGPILALSWLIFPLEVISHIARPITLGIRLMVNMFVDHLVVSVFAVLCAVLLPVPIMVLGILVVLVQTYVFCLLATVYIQIAVEHHGDEAEGDHGHHAVQADPPLAG